MQLSWNSTRLEKSIFNPVRFILLCSAVIFLTNCHKQSTSVGDRKTLLDQYVHKTDPSYHYEIVFQDKKEDYSFYVLKMISQEWLTEDSVDEPEWWHWIKITIPDSVQHSTGMMLIGGGSKDDAVPKEPGQILMQAALLTHSITAEIHNVPNQPLNFRDDSYGPRYEDELIAYGWKKFLEGGAKDEDAVWLARLPMTKAVVRAMDAVSHLIANETDQILDKFVVAGGSKRGWTTWTTAAVDNRVVAIVPVVIDLLNLKSSFEHHWRNYGFWAPAVDNYVEEGIMEWLHTPEFGRMLEITEPYSYLERFDIPKLIINATGDEFFQPDSWKFYWSDLIGEKHLRYVPNAGHSLKETDAIESLVSFYQYVLDGKERPDFDWKIEDSRMDIETDLKNPPAAVKLWHAATKGKARDFRIDAIGKEWSDSTIAINASGKYQIDLSLPEEGWNAYFVELKYEQEGKLPLKLTTGVCVIPNNYPFASFQSQREMTNK